ncbi:hypothetical protein ACHHYP_20872 [Achlya hypogyna]|uniref:Uncharacterized protein n=1 Tax=Achlya hypogyna TaxID=1202772 RepID=A0A1V9Y4H6_ACHHY|nr:hypothetical protein ACHHYP_20872 [Achlya hypogyna]
MSKDHVTGLFESTSLTGDLPPMTTSMETGDDDELSRLELETIMAVYEVLLAVHAPLIYHSDAVLVASTSASVAVITPHTGARGLATDTLAALWTYNDLGAAVKDLMVAMYDGDDDFDMRNAISTLAELVEAEEFDTTAAEHVLMHPTEPRLVVGDLVAAQLAAHRG